MADVKNFGLIGVGSNLQFGKGGTKLINNAGTFNFKAANGTSDAAVTLAGLTSSAGNVTLTTGDVVLSSETGKLTIGSTNMIQKSTGGVPQISGAGAVLIPTGSTASRPATTDGAGLLRVNNDSTTAAYVEFFNGTTWNTLATGGNTQSLQDEIDAIETSLGAMVTSTGTWNGSALTNSTIWPTSPTDLTNAINTLATYVDGKNTLDEIFPQTAAGNLIYSNGTNWVQAGPGSASGVQAWDAGLDALAAKSTTGVLVQTGANTYTSRSVAVGGGLTVSNADGVAGDITLGTTGNLAALDSMSTAGIAVRKADGTWYNRTITSNNTNITVTNGDGQAGNPTLDLAGNLAQVGGLTGVGFLVRHTGGSITEESLTGSAGRIVITNADGDAGSATIDLDTVTQGSTGNFVKVTLDGYGRVTGNTAVTTADITTLVDGTYVNITGDSMSGNLTMTGGATVTGLPTPVNASDAANKSYVDNAVSGLTWKQAANLLSATNFPLTGTWASIASGIDGHALNVSDVGYRIVLTNQTTASEEGIYSLTDVNGTDYALVRTSDAATYSELIGASIFIMEGTTYANTGWTQSNHYLTSFSGQHWVQFSGAGAYTGGTGISVAGTVINANLGAGLTTDTNNITIDIASGTALSKTSGLAIVLDTTATGGLDQTGGQLRIKAAGVTNAMLANSGFSLDADAGTSTMALGDTLNIVGDAPQGISTSVASALGVSTFTVTAADATTTSKGVASFSSASFATTAGAVTIKNAGVSNAQLANSSITVTGTSGSDAVALGESFAIISADSAITTTMGANSLSIQLNTVDVAHGGTGQTTLGVDQVMLGNGTGAVQTSSALSFTGTTLTVGATTINGGGTDTTITSTATNGNINLVPNGTGSVIVGPAGAGLVQSEANQALTVRGNSTLTLTSVTGDTTMAVPNGSHVNVTGPTAAQYATGLVDTNLTNKYYVDQAIASGAAAGAVKAFQAVVPLNANGTVNIGTAMPAGATVLRVKAVVNTADSAAQLSVGKSGSTSAYMTTSENDAQTQGMYVAETFVTEAGSVQIIATVASTGATSGSTATVIVEYQVAQ